MSRKCSILFSLFSPEKIEVNRYPNRRKSSRITGSNSPQSWAKLEYFSVTGGLVIEITLDGGRFLRNHPRALARGWFPEISRQRGWFLTNHLMRFRPPRISDFIHVYFWITVLFLKRSDVRNLHNFSIFKTGQTLFPDLFTLGHKSSPEIK